MVQNKPSYKNTSTIDWLKVYRKRSLTYRYYKKLKRKQKRLLLRSNLSPDQKSVAIKLKITHGITMRKAIKFTRIYWLNYTQSVSKRNFLLKPEKAKYVRKELLFQGWVECKDFKEYREISTKHDYITTNTNYPFSKLVYPEKFGVDYDNLKKTKNLRDVNNAFSNMALPEGFCKIQYRKHK